MLVHGTPLGSGTVPSSLPDGVPDAIHRTDICIEGQQCMVLPTRGGATDRAMLWSLEVVDASLRLPG